MNRTSYVLKMQDISNMIKDLSKAEIDFDIKAERVYYDLIADFHFWHTRSKYKARLED